MNWACRMSYRKKKCREEKKDKSTSCLHGKMAGVVWIRELGSLWGKCSFPDKANERIFICLVHFNM